MTHYYCEKCQPWDMVAIYRNGRMTDLYSRTEKLRFKAVRSCVCGNCKGWLYRLYRY